MLKLDLTTIRTLRDQLVSTDVHPNASKQAGISIPYLRDGIVWFGGASAMHSASYIDMFGIVSFRKLKRDVSKKKIDSFIKEYKFGGSVKKKIAELFDAIDKLSFMDSQGGGPLVYRAEVKAAIINVLAKWKKSSKR